MNVVGVPCTLTIDGGLAVGSIIELRGEVTVTTSETAPLRLGGVPEFSGSMTLTGEDAVAFMHGLARACRYRPRHFRGRSGEACRRRQEYRQRTAPPAR